MARVPAETALWGCEAGRLRQDTDRLLRQYGVSYVVIGPEEISPLPGGPGANLAYFQQHHRLVLQTREYEVFSVS